MNFATTVRRFLKMAGPFLPFSTKDTLSTIVSARDLAAIHEHTTRAFRHADERPERFAWVLQYFADDLYLVCYRLGAENRPEGDALHVVDIRAALDTNSIESGLAQLAAYTTKDQ